MDVNYIKVRDCIVPQAIVELHFCEIEKRLALSKCGKELPVAVRQDIDTCPVMLAYMYMEMVLVSRNEYLYI